MTISRRCRCCAVPQAALLGVVYLVDRSWAAKGLLPPWYLRMRLPLTTLAAGGLVLTAASGIEAHFL